MEEENKTIPITQKKLKGHQKSRRLAVWQIIQKDRVLLAEDKKGQRYPSQVSKGQSLLVQ